ncbi:15545_t:CDS:1 [Entrophospora sp. SA101]|nr:12393_t:CDS:1 [Entrophospora sp. SA101]CAJ0761343.1 15545_t:CDS:1 [Entrophospora sp. SA101]CAJ0851243.1 2161_t:CDS:1 [Entrophospora sp. SA101]CAJ0855581.1 17269_t:CDS:1 [Entrophospora sp. SA101]
MPLFEETNPKNNNQSADTKQSDNCGFANQKNSTPTEQKQKSSLLTIIGQLLPLAPFAFEQFTGQKVPHMSGTMADIQTNLQVVVNNQQALSQRLIALETKLLEIQSNANQHLTNLTNQFKSLRLTHTKEQKQIEYNPPENQENY